MSELRDDCMHPGEHGAAIKCPDCGRFSGHSWSTGWYSTQDGGNERFGGDCSKCGEWSDSAA